MPKTRWIPDRSFNAKTPFWTRANVGEVLPEPPSPAGWDLVFGNGGTIAGWTDCAVDRLGVGKEELDPDPNQGDWLGIFGGYGYLCATWIRVWGERTPGMSAAAIDAAYFGDHPDVPAYVFEPWHENADTTAVMTEWLGWVMGSMEQAELEADRLEARKIRAARPDFASMSEPALLDYALSFRPVCRRLFNQHINQSGAASIGPGTIGAICAAVGKPEVAMRLISGFGGVDSAAPSYAMWDLSRRVRASQALTSLFESGYAGLTERLKASSETEVQAFNATFFGDFLAEFGSRGPNEWDILSDTWETNPDLALAAIDRMRLAPDSASPSDSNASREGERKAAEADVLAVLAGDAETSATFSAALKSAQTFVPGRERSKTNIIRVIEETRMATWEIGRRHVAKGELSKSGDVCFLFEDELGELVNGRLSNVSALVDERRAHYEWLLRLEPPFIINGAPPPHSAWSKRNASTVLALGDGEAITGMPGCPGVARGRARVVLDPSDPTILEPGDILVAPMTDPAWTPLFVPAAGVVVDVGAALSHAIIVSRELGIPCVVSATNATRRIPDGALIEVNGDAGTVTLVSLS